jgi:rSAM/selenodomain-associated transferase 2
MMSKGWRGAAPRVAEEGERPRLSIVVPTLDEAAHLADTLASCRGGAACEVIVADGGSSDATVRISRALADRVVDAPRGRALQMNAGAAVARGDVLLFLHADTHLPAGFDRAVLAALADPRVVGGRFDLSLQPSSPLIRLTAELINLRSRLSRIATGDQALFIRRELFAALGGYRPQPLMEDIELSAAMKRHGRVACLRQRVVSSSRRWRRDGVIRTILLMWTLRFLYFCGVSPQRLRRWYADTR